ncbi:MAG TPA: hypothetical protein VL359_16395 [bacterium]|nr:hypothetical protein [bacterium]
MKRHKGITLLIARNYGRAHTLTLPLWKVYVGSALAATLMAALLGLSVLCLLVLPRWRSAEQRVRQLLQERNALQGQLLSANEEALEAKSSRSSAQVAQANPAGDDLNDPATIPPDPYTEPVRITSLQSKLVHGALEVSYVVQNQSPRGNRGGFLIAVLENLDSVPPQFQTDRGEQVNETGFPEFYKEGDVFSPVASRVTIRQHFKLASPQEYFTHVTVYAFSPRGGLMTKERFALDRAVFSQEHIAAGNS